MHWREWTNIFHNKPFCISISDSGDIVIKFRLQYCYLMTSWRIVNIKFDIIQIQYSEYKISWSNLVWDFSVFRIK